MFHPTSFQKTAFLSAMAAVAAILAAAPARAAVLDWNTTGAWTAGTPTVAGVNQNFTSTGGGGVVNVAIKDSSAGTVWQNGTNGVSTVASPGINNTLLTDHLTNQNALQLSVFSQPTNAAFVLVTVTFAQPSTNVSFTLWDVDQAIANQQGNATGNVYTDEIANIHGTTGAGATVNATSIVNGGSDGVDNTTTNATTVTGTQVTGGSANGGTENDALNSGQVSISFGATPIKSFTFEWLNPSAGGASTQQFIALGNINFTPVPEMKPGYAAVALCGGMVLCGAARERRRKRLSICSPGGKRSVASDD